jgi:hypothetical protein
MMKQKRVENANDRKLFLLKTITSLVRVLFEKLNGRKHISRIPIKIFLSWNSESHA